MSRFPDRREDLAPAQQAAWDAIAASRGKVPAPYLPLLASPATALAFEQFSSALWASSLALDEQELVYLVVAQAWRCEHQWRTHEPKAREAGVPAELIAWVAAGSTEAAPPAQPRLLAVVRVARSLQKPHSLPDEVLTQALAVLGAPRVSDLLAFTTLATSIAMLLHAA